MKKEPIYWIPSAIIFIMNMIFLIVIFILKLIGKGLVWINNKLSDAGEYCTEKAQGESKADQIQIIVDKLMGGK